MERAAVKQVKFGRACTRCRSYFVTSVLDEHICPWCQRIEVGGASNELYEPLETPVE